MSRANLKESIEKNLCNKTLIIVSNREPYIHKKIGSYTKVEKPAGGLTSALDEVLRATGGTWVAWGSGTGDRESVDNNSRVRVPPDSPSYTLRRVWLSPEEINNYYHGYSNQMLWPLCHIALDRVYFRKKYWDDYKKANLAFTKAVLEEINDRSIVWVHDYHLCLVPLMLKDKKPDVTVAHFWHIPWPNYSVFRICPQSGEIIKALLNNDLLAFHTSLFVNNFIDCVKETVADAEIDYKNLTVTHKGHATRLKAFPISVDYEKFDSLASSPKTLNALEQLKIKYSLSEKFLGIGVDRLEYTKGLIKRLQAIDLFFERYPEYKGKFTFIQIAVPTRMKEPYISYKLTVEGLIKRINRKYAMENWNPIIYKDTKAEHKDLVVYYRMADIAIISSIYDGMNLVAKEYVASQVDKKGALLLSEFAGAAEELEGAILVNPYDIEGFSDCIKKALELSGEEKKCRMKTLRNQVKEKDIYRWISDIIIEVSKLHEEKIHEYRYVFDHTASIPKNNIFLFLDYDGTLTPIVASPDKAKLSMDMRRMIDKLKGNFPLAVISGRSISDIRGLVSVDNIIYVGNHGAEIWADNKIVAGQHLSVNKEVLEKIIKELKDALSDIKGAIVEDKGITASIHFRMVENSDICKLYNTFWSITDSYKGLLRITTGKKVFEIRPHGVWNKGDAVKWIMDKFGKDRIPVYIGDDATDEDAFKAIRGKGVAISIGTNKEADYYLKNQEEIRRFLKWIGNF